jgi:hypothetical protein
MVPPVKVPEWDTFQTDNPDLITRKGELENKHIIGKISLDELKCFINGEWLPKSVGYEAAHLWLMSAKC